MKYKCVAFPHCLKTYDYGHALRAHLASCEHAQKIFDSKANVEKLERHIAIEYPSIYGLHSNTYYPTSYGLDHTSKLYFTDTYKFTPNDGKLKSVYRRQKKGFGSNIFESAQVKKALTYE